MTITEHLPLHRSHRSPMPGAPSGRDEPAPGRNGARTGRGRRAGSRPAVDRDSDRAASPIGVVAVTFPFSAEACAEAERRLGTGIRVVDARAVDRADVVLVHPCSAQTMTLVRATFPDAAVVVVEAASALDRTAGGPVTRMLSAGADAYLAEVA